MKKYAVMIVLDLDVEVLDSTEPREVETVAETRVRTALKVDSKKVKIKMLRTKLLGLAEK